MSASDREHSFRDFYDFCIQQRISSNTYDLVHAELGTSKEKMDRVDLDLPVVTVVESFGRFLKYLVKQKQKEGESCSSTASTLRNAFDVLMSSQRALQRSRLLRQLPEPVDERNKNDKLFNDLLLFMESKNLKLEHDEIQSFGQRLVKALRDTLWYIDGREDVFSRRSSAIPSGFVSFRGYNCPEKANVSKAICHVIS